MNFYYTFGANNCFSETALNTFFSSLPNIFSDSLENYNSMCYINLIWGAV